MTQASLLLQTRKAHWGLRRPPGNKQFHSRPAVVAQPYVCVSASKAGASDKLRVCVRTCQHHARPACLLEQHSNRTKVGREQWRGRTGVVPKKLPQGEASRQRIEATCSTGPPQLHCQHRSSSSITPCLSEALLRHDVYAALLLRKPVALCKPAVQC